jgi:membrane-bound inhibitor of C-type lysozyme
VRSALIGIASAAFGIVAAGCTNGVESAAKANNAVDLSAVAKDAAADIGNYSVVAPVPPNEKAAGDVVRGMFAALLDRRLDAARVAWRDPASARKLEGERRGYDRFMAEVGRAVPDARNDEMTVPLEVVGTPAKGEQALYVGEAALVREPAGTGDWRIVSVELSPPMPARITATYRCTGGAMLAVAFDNRRQTAVVTSGRAAWRLEQQRAASGIDYTGDGAVLRGKGRDADWTVPGGSTVRCRTA